MDGASSSLLPASASPYNSQMLHWLHIQVTLRKGLDGAADVLLNFEEGTVTKGAHCSSEETGHAAAISD